MRRDLATTVAKADQTWPGAARVAAVTIIALGIAWTLTLWSDRTPGAFYAADAGLKALWIEQAAQGEWHADLRLPAPTWVQELWDGGFYPFGPNFVWTLEGGRRFLSFPLPFLAASVPGYWIAGSAGLYLWPLLGVWLLWIGFVGFAMRWHLDPLPSLAVLGGLVFASPLTLHGILFSEHAPAAAVSFAGAVGLLATLREADVPRRPWVPALAGALLGAAAWLRPECAVLAIAALGMAVGWASGPARRASWAWAVAGAAAALGLFVLLNLWLYGLPLGAHALQVLSKGGGGLPLTPWGRVAAVMLRALIVEFPLVLAAVATAASLWIGAGRRRGEVGWLLAVSALFVAGTILIVPNAGGKQWGPRYLMPMVPLVCLATLLAIQGRSDASGRRRGAWVLAALVAPAIAFGVWRNTVLAGPFVAHDATISTAPALELVRRKPGDVIVVDHHYVAMALQDAFSSHHIFLPRSPQQMIELVSTLAERDRTEFLLFRSPGREDPERVMRIDDHFLLRLDPAGPAGRFTAWWCRIELAS